MDSWVGDTRKNRLGYVLSRKDRQNRGIIIGEISAGGDSQEVTSGAASKRQLHGFTCVPRESSRCPFLSRCEKFLDRLGSVFY